MNEDPKTIAEIREQITELTKRVKDLETKESETQSALLTLKRQVEHLAATSGK
jgi:archaellum component FlaC